MQAGAGAGIGADDAVYRRGRGAHRRHGGGGVRRGRDDRQGQGAAGGRVDDAARGPDPLHLPAPRAGPGADRAACSTSGCTAVAYETVTDARGGLPLLAPMSEVAGRLAIEAAALALQQACRRHGPADRRRAGRAAGARRRSSAAASSARMRRAWRSAWAPKSRSSTARCRACASSTTCSRAGCARASRASTTIEEEVLEADVVIGAVLVPGASAPQLS